MTRTHIPSFAADYPEVAVTLEQARLPFYCTNCYRKRETSYLTPNFGPFCDECLQEAGKVGLVKKGIFESSGTSLERVHL